MNLIIADHNDESNNRSTQLTKGDVLLFDTKNNTVSIHRPLLETGKEAVRFSMSQGHKDDKCLMYMTDENAILEACKMMCCFLNVLDAEFENPKEPKDKFGVVRIKLV